jgi:transcriptional regulator with XRE-family HTH domain
MGSAARRKPARLAGKLLQIRQSMGLSQNGLIRRMGLADELTQAEISMFERGLRVPSLPVLLEYARAANVYLEALVADELDLPAQLPAEQKSEGVKRTQRARSPARRN